MSRINATHPYASEIIEAIRNHPDFGRDSNSTIDWGYTDDELIDFFGFEGGRYNRFAVGVEKAVANAQETHELAVHVVQTYGEDN